VANGGGAELWLLHHKVISALAEKTAVTVLLETQGADFTAWELRAFLTATDVTAVLILQVSKWTILVTDYGSALLGPWAALTDLTVVGISQETEGAVQSTALLEARAQLLPMFALTGSTTIVIKFETINAVLLCQRTV